MYILIVEDDDSARRGLETLLQEEGHTTCWASTGESALEMLRTEKVDLVLLDIMLKPGGMDGVDVAVHKMQDPAAAGIPVIIMSALEADMIRQRAQRQIDALASARLIMGKPLNFGLLLQAINALKK